MIRKPQPRHSFGRRLSRALTATSVGAIMLVCLVLSLLYSINLRNETIAALELQTRIVVLNSSAPLAFSDPASAAEALAVLQARPGVAEATLFDARSVPFARYAWHSEPPPGLAAQPLGLSRHGRWLALVEPIEDRGQHLGRIQVVYDMSRIEKRQLHSLLLSLLITLIGGLLVYLFSWHVRRGLMQPISALNDIVGRVSATGDYGLRAPRLSEDEFGAFTDAFNDMLARIQRQDEEIRQARAEAEAASRLKDEFLATLSHELRTPLTPILSWAQILRRSPADPDRLQQGVEVIERNARAQTQIIDDLLDMSRIISGKLRLRLQRLDPAEVVDAALDTVEATAGAKGVRLQRRVPPALPAILGDPNRLQQVAWNLLANAIKFTERGGEVVIELRAVAGAVELVVSDTGEGIAADFLPYVFDRFRQADSSATRSHGGLGLGLAIARQLVELHGGRVQADSPGVGLGAVVTVRLPQAASGSDTPLAEVPPGLDGGSVSDRGAQAELEP